MVLWPDRASALRARLDRHRLDLYPVSTRRKRHPAWQYGQDALDCRRRHILVPHGCLLLLPPLLCRSVVPSRQGGGRLVVRPILATNDPWAVYRDVARGPELAICELCSTIYDHFDHCRVGKLRSSLDLDTAHFKSCEGLEDRAFRTRTEA